MSSILGIMDYGLEMSPGAKSELLRAMAATLRHRSPHGFTYENTADNILFLGRGRRSEQPDGQIYLKEGGRAAFAFDGNVYDFGAPGNGDAGDIPIARRFHEHLLPNMAERLAAIDGNFAFAMYESGAGLILGRDVFGDKPLYWCEGKGVLAFASELTALQALPFFDFTLDMDAVAEFLGFQYIGAPRTIYASAKKIPPGHFLRCGMKGEVSLVRHSAFTPGLALPDPRPAEELSRDLEAMLRQRIRERCSGRSVISSFLSGGVDSSTVAALARDELGLPVHTFTLGFSGSPNSEHEQARELAKAIGSEHHEFMTEADACGFLAEAGDIMDEPNGDTSCMPLYLLSRVIRESGAEMALSGDCGDELFGGYPRYSSTLDENWTGADSLGRRYYSGRIMVFQEPDVGRLLGGVPGGFARHLRRLRAELDSSTWIHPLHRMRRTDFENYTPGAPGTKADRMAMRHGLEIRSPFLSVKMLRFAETLDVRHMLGNGLAKVVLRGVANRYLPRGVLEQPKKGFGLPMDGWGKRAIVDFARDALGGGDSRLGAIGDRRGIGAFLAEQEQRFHPYQLWVLCILESYLRKKKSSPQKDVVYARDFSEWRSVEEAAQEWTGWDRLLRTDKPVMLFLGRDMNPPAPLSNLPANVRIVSAALPGGESSGHVTFDWEAASSFEALRGKVEKGMIACFGDLYIPSSAVAKKLKGIGLRAGWYVHKGASASGGRGSLLSRGIGKAVGATKRLARAIRR